MIGNETHHNRKHAIHRENRRYCQRQRIGTPRRHSQGGVTSTLPGIQLHIVRQKPTREKDLVSRGPVQGVFESLTSRYNVFVPIHIRVEGLPGHKGAHARVEEREGRGAGVSGINYSACGSFRSSFSHFSRFYHLVRISFLSFTFSDFFFTLLVRGADQRLQEMGGGFRAIHDGQHLSPSNLSLLPQKARLPAFTLCRLLL